SSIAAACAEYVVPKFMTMNIQELLSGSGVKTKTHALGVIMVTIHHASGLSAQDASGYSDPYIVLAFAKFGKPVFSTRIIEKELNPVFEETAFLLLSEDEVEAQEKLSVMLWDSDDRSADDLVGRIEIPVRELIKNPNQMSRRTEKLQGFQDADDFPGQLTWSVGYFAKVDLASYLQKGTANVNSGASSTSATVGLEKEESPSGKQELLPEKEETLPEKKEDLIDLTTKSAPNRQMRSGIVSVIIHHINNLERANLKGASGDREGAQGQDTAEPSEQDDNLPSGVKQYTTMPFLEAGTEHLIRDWTETVIRIAVRDSRIREKDPLLGWMVDAIAPYQKRLRDHYTKPLPRLNLLVPDSFKQPLSSARCAPQTTLIPSAWCPRPNIIAIEGMLWGIYSICRPKRASRIGGLVGRVTTKGASSGRTSLPWLILELKCAASPIELDPSCEFLESVLRTLIKPDGQLLVKPFQPTKQDLIEAGLTGEKSNLISSPNPPKMASLQNRYCMLMLAKQENYSARNPVPTIENYEQSIKDLQATSNETQSIKSHYDNNHLDGESTPQPDHSDKPEKKVSDSDEGAETEKQEIMKRMKSKDENPAKDLQLRGQRTVKDPVTNSNVIISDSQFDTNQASQNHALSSPQQSDQTDPTLHISPSPITPGNICLQPFPPPVPTNILKESCGGRPLLELACGHFLWRSSLFGIFGIFAFVQGGLLSRKIEKEFDKVRFEMHRQRGIQNSPPTPESTEWLNAFISTLMGLINPDMFLPLADTIEDVMQASLPSFIDAVKVSDLGVGATPFRILSMRALPDQPGDPAYPRDNWITGDYHQGGSESDKLRGEQSGDYVNYEVAFAYQAQPGQTNKLRAHNIHLMVEFFVGVFDWVHIPIPIWIQIEGLAGTIRMRLQMIQEPPYIRNLTFTMMGVPTVSVSAKPMMRSIPNILDLPVISGFVQSSIAAACAEYVVPKFMTMNIQELLSGSGVKTKTHALGVIMVTIHHASGLSAQDASGYSDPYIVLAFAKFGKPVFSTRIIEKELNPVFEETAFLLLSEDEVEAQEKLSVMLWDSDDRSADDLVGRIEIPVRDLIENPNQMSRRTDKLQGFQDADDMPGQLTWSVGYFAKVDLASYLQKGTANVTSGASSTSATVGRKGGIAIRKEEVLPEKKEDLIDLTTKTAPNRQMKSGIVSVIIHHINNLERANLKGASGDREGAQGQDTAEPSEQDDNLPSGYCEVIVNDEMIYKTRVKQYTTMPFFEAGTEHFIRDWTETPFEILEFREKDPLLGVINIDLEQLFEDSSCSQVTRIFALQEGVGFGRAQISVLFESVELQLPRNLLGWNTATLEITSPIKAELPEAQMKTRRHYQASFESPNSVVWGNECQIPDHDRTLLRVPIYSRYKSNVTFQIGGGSKITSILPGESSAHKHIAVLWLHTLEDDVEQEIRLPVISGPNLATLRQNFINEETRAHHNYDVNGYLTFKARVDPGLDPEHARYAQSSVAKHTFEAYDNTEGQAEQALRNAHALAHKKDLSGSSDSAASTNSDGHAGTFRLSSIISNKSPEEKAIEAAHKKSLSSRHRAQCNTVHIWMKEGIVKRARELKNRITKKVEKE
ncbi:hypothetical protein PSTT_14025, partial [Puccinia striiformis]